MVGSGPHPWWATVETRRPSIHPITNRPALSIRPQTTKIRTYPLRGLAGPRWTDGLIPQVWSIGASMAPVNWSPLHGAVPPQQPRHVPVLFAKEPLEFSSLLVQKPLELALVFSSLNPDLSGFCTHRLEAVFLLKPLCFRLLSCYRPQF